MATGSFALFNHYFFILFRKEKFVFLISFYNLFSDVNPRRFSSVCFLLSSFPSLFSFLPIFPFILNFLGLSFKNQCPNKSFHRKNLNFYENQAIRVYFKELHIDSFFTFWLQVRNQIKNYQNTNSDRTILTRIRRDHYKDGSNGMLNIISFFSTHIFRGILRKESSLTHFFFFFAFQGYTSGMWRFPGQGVKSELPLPAYATAHGDAGSLTHWARPVIKPTTSWFLVGFVSMTGTRLIHS